MWKTWRSFGKASYLRCHRALHLRRLPKPPPAPAPGSHFPARDPLASAWGPRPFLQNTSAYYRAGDSAGVNSADGPRRTVPEHCGSLRAETVPFRLLPLGIQYRTSPRNKNQRSPTKHLSHLKRSTFDLGPTRLLT